MVDKSRIVALRDFYRQTLLDDVVPFWMNHALDREFGGYFNLLDRDGSLFGTDKAIWLQGRAVWLFATLYNTIDARPDWLEAARLGYEFLVRHGFDSDGRMFFQVTREGLPVIKRRYYFSETFAIIAFAQYAKAAGDADALRRAKAIYRMIVEFSRNPGLLPPKVNPQTRALKSHAIPMVMLSTSQELRALDEDPLYDEVIQESLDQILNHHLKPEKRLLFEHVGPNGELRLDLPEGRKITPGHAIESGWFMLHEARHRNDPALVARAAEVIRWSLEFGWDPEHGGVLYFMDAEGKPPVWLEWDQKLWWPHTEALYALLLAHHLTGDDSFADWYERVHDWSFGHFADPDYGEWYGYLHRDGSLLTPLKGSMWKGVFHLPRALWLCYRLLSEMAGER